MDFLQPLSAVVLVLALLAGALFLLKKRGALAFRMPAGASGAGRRLEVLERISLGPQHALHLVRAGDRLVLIATAPGSCQLTDAPASMAVTRGERP